MHGTGKRKEKPISERANRSKKFKIEVIERKPHDQPNTEQEKFVTCPICNKTVLVYRINEHLDECERKTAQERTFLAEQKSNGQHMNASSMDSVQSLSVPPENAKESCSLSLPRGDSFPHSGSLKASTSAPVESVGRPAESPSSLQSQRFEFSDRPVDQSAPLAERVRPRCISDVIGQDQVIGEGSVLWKLLKRGSLPSLILWGPPGTGKTTIGRLLAKEVKAHFVQLSATGAGVADVKKAVETARNHKTLTGQKTVIFIDEIHRFNKLQQDIFLPSVENGDITLIGATTENPSFEINSALLSRCRVLVLSKLSKESIKKILDRAIRLENIKNISEDAIDFLSTSADGDARMALNCLGIVAKAGDSITISDIHKVLKQTHLIYDKHGDMHYDTISALHKSVRGSDVQASLYWAARMLRGGDDPRYVCRRLVRMASEDIGLADPMAMSVAVAAFQATMMIGMPECKANIFECVAYLAMAPKSNAMDVAIAKADEIIDKTGSLPVPLHIRNAPTKLMENLGYGKGYIYNPDYDDDDPRVLAQTYFPDELLGTEIVDLSKLKFPVSWPSYRFDDKTQTMIPSQISNQMRNESNDFAKPLENKVSNDVLGVNNQSHNVHQNVKTNEEKKEEVDKIKTGGSQNHLHDEALDSELLKLFEKSEKALPIEESAKASPRRHESDIKVDDSVQQSDDCKNGVEENQSECEKGESQKRVLSELNNSVNYIEDESKVLSHEHLDNDSIEDDDFQLAESTVHNDSHDDSGANENGTSFPLIRPIVSFTEEMVNKHNLFNYSKQ